MIIMTAYFYNASVFVWSRIAHCFRFKGFQCDVQKYLPAGCAFSTISNVLSPSLMPVALNTLQVYLEKTFIKDSLLVRLNRPLLVFSTWLLVAGHSKPCSSNQRSWPFGYPPSELQNNVAPLSLSTSAGLECIIGLLYLAAKTERQTCLLTWVLHHDINHMAPRKYNII